VFRTNLRIRKATYKLNNEIVGVLNDKLCVLGIFCDLAKAFHLLTRQFTVQIKFH